MKSDNRMDVVHHSGLEDLPGFHVDSVQCPDGDDMETKDLGLGIKGDDTELLHRFGADMEQRIQSSITC